MKRLILLVLVLCLNLAACTRVKEERVPPTRSTEPILDLEGNNDLVTELHTPVYVTVFGDTAYLGTYPKVSQGLDEPLCSARDISKGGKILCNHTHEKTVPVTRVVIMDEIHPDSTADWFRDMTALLNIEGLGYLRVENVTDMSNMFNGCGRLAVLEINNWNVTDTVNMTGMFAGCDALVQRPTWYQE